jgi:uncharacterized protein
VSWYRKAAEQGDAHAQFNLGVMYADGIGVPQDAVQAYMWYNLAAAQGVNQRMVPSWMILVGDYSERESLEVALTGEQKAEGQRLSREWKPIDQRK